MFKIELKSLTDHETLKIVLGEDEQYTDLYYYCLDNTFFEDERTLAKGFLNFVSMVENWKLKIKNLTIGASAILPFDYSDQYIGFFIVARINDVDVDVQAAVTLEFKGGLINPSQLYLEDFTHKPYELDGKKYKLSIHQLLEDIENSMTAIFSSFYKKDF